MPEYARLYMNIPKSAKIAFVLHFLIVIPIVFLKRKKDFYQ